MIALIKKIYEAYLEWRKERIEKKLRIYGGVASKYDFERTEQDIEAIIEILGYERDKNIFASMSKHRFVKKKRSHKA